MKPVVLHPEADEEYAVAAKHYANISRQLGGRFYDEIERLILEIRKSPAQFRQYEPPARRNLGRSFPFAVVYLDEPDCVWVVAIMHLHREPDYWKRRLG
ncbi:hypothetical protein M2103_001588 [Ereboglobus sp. PH5-5]|uniref:Plasmid stabilization protein n=1 Tax=Ereboglobus luteus TaxID=1796921 RepID=A0A2U8DZT5_9BACT|nr:MULTISPECIES: type II toxin-antitoxin system RelE/ParE family toxin [Ereboglobus]AWI08113.1 hypothetical protein CKA38_01530 [Ereboglobus luteus]MDF9833364.1 hypothetical protein [Ereboglobus sp. PH5-5]